MKCSLGISNFLEEISSLSHSVVFLYISALIAEEGFLTLSCCSLELFIQMGISFLFFFAFRLSSFHSYEDLQDLLELIPHNGVFFIIGNWNAKVESKETPGVTGKFDLEYRMKQSKD